MAALIRSPFRALVLVLAVGACVVAAKLADSILSDAQPPSPPASVKPTPPAATNETEPPSPPSTEALATESAPSPKSDPQPAPEAGDAVPTKLPLKLLGTMTDADRGMSMATVYEDTTQHSRTVWLGSKREDLRAELDAKAKVEPAGARRRSRVHLRADARRVRPVRKADAGNLHVRFDEQRGGNRPWVRLGEKASESGPSQQAPTNPRGTAPPADSTPLASLAGGENPACSHFEHSPIHAQC